MIAAKDLAAARKEMDVNYFGTLTMIRAFAPILKANGGGTIVNVASIAGLVSLPIAGSYAASKAAVHSMTQGVRGELAGQGTTVIGVYPGPIDTDMVAALDMPKTAPEHVASAVLGAVVEGVEDVFPDDKSAQIHAALLRDPKQVEKQRAARLPGR